MSAEAVSDPEDGPRQLWELPDDQALVEAYISHPLHEDFDVDPAFSKAFLLNERIKLYQESYAGWNDDLGARIEYVDNEIKNIDVMMESHWNVYHRKNHRPGECSCMVCLKVDQCLNQLQIEAETKDSKIKTLAGNLIRLVIPKPV
jgi:hypothetical protein